MVELRLRVPAGSNRSAHCRPMIHLLPLIQLSLIGGATRDRTADLLDANQTLSQLSYSPNIHLMTKSVLIEARDGKA